MKKFVLLLSAAVSLYSCMPPAVNRVIMKTYPPRSQDSSVVVYFSKSEIPVHAENLGIVSVYDSGASSRCDSVSVVNIIKEEARKAGGNGAYVSEYIKPSFWGSSCHQMTASLLWIGDFRAAADTGIHPVAQLSELKRIKPERTLSQVQLSLNAGYGFRTAKISDQLTQVQQQLLRELKSGIALGASGYYFFNDWTGLGLLFSQFNSQANALASTASGAQGIYNIREAIRFVGPSYAYRFKSGESWLVGMQLAIGYVGFEHRETLLNELYTVVGATAGTMVGFDVEYKFARRMGAFASLGLTSGTLTSYTENKNGVVQKVELDKDRWEGLGTANVMLGVRFHLK